MRYSHVLSLVAALPSTYAVAFGGPAPTDISPDRALEGTSPKPTRGPSVEELRKRQSSSQATCGWVDGDISNALTCSVGRTCMLYKSAGLNMAGCCEGRDTQNCGWASSCVDFVSYSAGSCGSNCLIDPLVRKCTNAAAPYCVTWTYPSDGVEDFGCDSASTGSIITVRQTAQDGFSGSTSTRLPTVTAGAVTETTGTSGSGTSGSYTTPSSRTSKKLAIGAIIGIVLAVLGLAFLAIVGVCICMKRKKKQKQIAANAQLMANVQASRPESQFQPQMQMQQGPPQVMPPQSPPPPMNGYFPPPNPQEQKYTGHTSVQEYKVSPVASNATTPAPAYVQPYMASNAPPMPHQGQYQPPANGAHEVASPVEGQYGGQYQAPLNGAHEVPSPPISEQYGGQYQPPANGAHEVPSPHTSPPPQQQFSAPAAGAHEMSAPGKTGPVYEMGGR
ncbi:hypothetical protein HBI73_159580 [Parastagonospora nodorum]|nr:hypothetical protein HBH51_172690 [Parastagonospora nodorum]KAH5083448.1 hypothetical protein HBI73_159580 [Parastagonospora nodorum]